MKFLLFLLSFLFIFPSAFAQNHNLDDLAGKLSGHVAYLASDSLEGRGLGTEGKLRARDYIAELFDSFGLKKFNQEGFIQDFEIRINLVMVKGENVIGWLPGNDTVLKNEYIVVGAHYDHLGYYFSDDQKQIYHGADDNASGVAVMIELARYFAANPGQSKRSIIFIAFDAEESGLLGSQKFLELNDRFNISSVKAMFSFDMVGMYKANSGVDLFGITAIVGGKDLASSIALERHIQVNRMTVNFEPRTDTWYFGKNGIPSIQVFTGVKSPYHKTDDTYEKLDYDGMAMVTDYLEELIAGLSEMPEIAPSRHFERIRNPYSLRINGGIEAGAGASRHRLPESYYVPKSIFAYNAGVFLQMNIGQRISIQPEILFQCDGSKADSGTFRRQSIIIPVNLHINILNENLGLYKMYPFIGAYYLHAFDGKYAGKKIDFGGSYSRIEWGINAGIGADVQDLQVRLIWRRSVTNLLQESTPEMFSSMWFLSLGYKF